MKRFYAFFLILLAITTWILHLAIAQEEEDWMPDPNLRKAVREKLGVRENEPLTLEYMQLHLTNLIATDKGIVDLTGLELATDLQVLGLGRNKIHDLSPLSGLTKLSFLDLGGNEISDLSPLARLVNLDLLRLGGNQITDVSPLAGLVNLKVLSLSYNQIVDLSPLAGLPNLENLEIQGNEDNKVLSTLPRSKLMQFGYDETCDLAGVPISERIENREYPSIFSAWGNIINLPNLSWKERLAYHDEHWSSLLFHLKWLPTSEGLKTLLHVESAKEYRDEMLSLNPNMIFIVPMNYWAVNPGEYPDDWPYWVRDESGERIVVDEDSFLIDFTQPEVRDFMVRRAVAFAKCGLYDGIFFDVWRDDWRNREDAHYYTYDVHEAAITMLRRIREEVDAIRDNFLIIVNTNDTKIPHSAPYVNGMYMETIGPYTHQHLTEIESTLLWGEQHLREPRINSLEGWGIPSEPFNSQQNQQRMRLFTTMSLTHSDGFMRLYRGITSLAPHTHFYDHRDLIEKKHSEVHERGEPHSHPELYWYPFYDAPLGRPVGGDETKGQRYVNRAGVPIEGIFIREYTNGWAVYNRSGKEQQIELPEKVSGVASGVTEKRSHVLPDLDGEIYLKTPVQVAPGKYPPLYWTDARIGVLYHLANNKVENPVPRVQNAISLAVDAAPGKLYWTEKTGNRTGKIQSANLDGTNTQLVRNLTSVPLDIAIDTTAGKLYLSNAWGKIQRMNLDGSDFQPNLVTDLKTPQNLVLDTTNSKLYWIEQTSKTTGKIQRANLDGSNVQLVKKLTSAPHGMALDAVNRKLYLTNAWGKLQRMNLDGSNFQPNFITGLVSPGQVIVDVTGGKVYWTEKGKLRRAGLDGGNIQDVVIGLGELTDIALGIQTGPMDVAAAPATQTVVEQTSLLTNYPNPFNPETWIPYHLATDTDVEIRIYDTRGSIVRRLDLGHQREGYYTSRSRAAYWDGRNDVGERVASGIYFYQLKADNRSFLRKMVILK
ncbi:MAG: leucine-rich repeat domain-containing protein [Candidatus Poribacteria bacterium]|nr:leucine-rich repeat domain-containing protein [Candidatus Poribacteria bacterium]